MEVSCPVSAERINENVVRIIALLVAIVAVLCIVFGNYFAVCFMTIDFATRAFTTGKWSLLKLISLQIFNIFSLPVKMTDLAPKKFAAALGFVCCLLISVFYLFNFYQATLILTLILIGFAILESMLAICVGCYLYTFWQLLFGSKNV